MVLKTLGLFAEPIDKIIVVYRPNMPNVYVNEQVTLTKREREIGTARVLHIDRVSLWDKSNYNVPSVTERDAKQAGFKNIGHMRRVLGKRNDGITVPLYKITLRRDLR